MPAGHASGLACLDVSADGQCLVGVGLDSHSRQLIILWDIAQLLHGGKVHEFGLPVAAPLDRQAHVAVVAARTRYTATCDQV